MSDLLLAYAGLFAWSFLAATVLSLGSEVALAALVRAGGRAGVSGRPSWWRLVVAWAAAGLWP